ncbi:MAG: hypothetical protein JO222_14750 [Frankiales bacterium]|nr:hypothetical protein [Frankiales bacterium]
MDIGIRDFADLARVVRAQPGPTRLVGVDGCGGAGKTTFAGWLAEVFDNAPVVHTDDFASHAEPTQWWPAMLRDVIEPLSAGRPATYAPYDWTARQRAHDKLVVPPAPVVVIEGVGATRSAWRDRLALRIWVDAPRALRLDRGITRDGEELRDFWQEWMAAEDEYVAAERPFAYADVVVDGDPQVPYDASREFVEIRGLSEPR